MSLNSMTVTQLRELMGEYNLSEPKGNGDKGKVLKTDLINHIKEYETENNINRKGTKKADAKGEKAPPKAKSPTAGLKAGDKVLFVEGKYNFEAIVTGRIASTKVMITPIVDVDDIYNTKKEADVARKSLTIVGGDDGTVGADAVKLTIKGANKTININVNGVDIDQLCEAFTGMLDVSDIKYVKK